VEVSSCTESWALIAYSRPNLVTICSTVVARRPSTCRESRLFVFVSVNGMMDCLGRDALRRVAEMIIVVRGRYLRSGRRRQWQMSICCWNIGNRGASKALLPPCKVGESARGADPVPIASERVGISTGSPSALLQTVVVHGQGVGAVGKRGFGFVCLSN
jgi:hypothetical protein